jgi:hypothetical protein
MTTSTAQTISITLSITIDPESWTLNYGTEGRAAIRKDVREYVRSAVEGNLENSGIGCVEVRTR